MPAFLLSAGFCPVHVHAQTGPSSLSISGVMLKSDGTPLLNSSVNFRFELYDKNGTCVLYSEEHLGVDLSTSKGRFSLAFGRGSSPQNYLENSTTFTGRLFQNDGAPQVFTGCGGVTLSSGDERLIRVHYNLGSGYLTMTPDVGVESSGFALVADTLRGKTPSDFVQLRDDATYDLTQANVQNVFSATNYARLNTLLSSSGSFSFGSQRITSVADPTSAQDAATKNYADTYVAGQQIDLQDVGAGTGDGKVLTWDAAQGKWVAEVASATDVTKLPLAGGTMSGVIHMGSNNLLATGHITMSAQTTLNLGTYTDAQETTLVGTLAAVDKGKSWYNSDDNVLKVWDGSRAVTQAYLSNTDKIQASWLPDTTVTGGSYGSATQVATFTVGADGRLTAAGNTTISGVVPGGSAGGDLTGSYPNPTIANDVITSAKVNSTGVAVNRLLITNASDGSTIGYATCSVGEVMKWTASGWACASDDGGSGDITEVAAGTGLTGGGTSGAVTLAVDVGTTDGKIVQMAAGDKLPAVDGSDLTNVNAVKLQARSVASTAPNNGEVLTWNNTTSVWEPSTVSALISGSYFVQDGNSFGVPTVLGTNDAQPLHLETDGVTRITATAAGKVGIGTSVPQTILEVSGSGPSHSHSLATLSGAHTSGVTTITVNSTANYPSSGIIWIDSEAITYTGITGTTFTGVTRGAQGTTAAAHSNGKPVRLGLSLFGSSGNPSVVVMSDGGLQTGNSAATGKFSSALGSGTATGTRSLATGNGTAATGINSVALGYLTLSSHDNTVAMGHSTTASGYVSFAGGFNTTANGWYSTALGFATSAPSYAQVSIGQYNVTGGETANSWVATDPLFVIGNGTGSGINASNAITVLKNGKIGIGTPTPNEMLDVVGKIRATHVCASDGSNCKDLTTSWGSGGSVTEVTAGSGLSGGTITASGTLSVDVGTTAGKIVQMAAGDKLPAVDGSDLTNVNAVKLQTRSVASTAPNNGEVLKWNSTTSVWEPSADTDTDTGITALTGDVSASGTGSVVATLADSVVTSAKIADGTIATADIADDAITSAKLNSAGVAANRLLITDANTGTKVQYATCSTDEVLKWTASGWACSTVGSLISGSYFTQNGNSFGAETVLGTNDSQPLHLETGGSTRLTIGATGNVGIGTTSPGALLNVHGSVNGNTYSIFDVATGTSGNYKLVSIRKFGLETGYISPTQFFLNDGNAGGGALATVTVRGNASVYPVIYGYGANAQRIGVYGINGGSAGNGAGVVGQSGANPGIIAESTGTTNDSLVVTSRSLTSGRLLYVEQTTSAFSGDAIQVNLGQGTGSFDGNFINLMTNGSSKFVVKSDGKVGIGTTSPQALLDVVGPLRIQASGLPGSPLTGVIAIDSGDGNKLKWYDGSSWQEAGDGSGTSGTVTHIEAGTGLSGGTITTSGTLSVDVGTAAGQIVQMAAGDKLPQVDGSDLTNVNAVKLQTRTVASTAPNDGEILKWNATTSVWEPAVDAGTGITALTGDVSASGTGSVTATLADSVVTSVKIADGTIATADIADDAVTSAKVNSAGVAVNRLLITDAASGTQVKYATCSLDEVLKWTASGWACSTVSSVISGSYFSQNGNSFGAEAVLGTNDTRPLHFETDGATRMTVGAGGNVGVGTTNPAGMLDVRGGTAAAGTSGSSIFLIAQNAGTGAGVEAAGGSVTITAGNPTGTGAGSVAGSVSITGGSNVSMAGGGGHVTITGGAAASGNKPGNVVISAGASSNSVGGNVTVQASAGAGNNNGGTLTLNSGAGAGSNAGGLVSITAGSGGFSSTGGNVSITAGAGGSSSGNAGSVTINGGTPVSGAGGSVSLTAKAGVGTNQNGGNITLTAGAATGSGTAGTIQLLSGNVGVGTTAPSLSGSGTVVHVHDSGGNASAIHLTNSDSGVAATDGSILGLATDESLVLGSYEATPILFLSSGSERVRISSAGNVGVGTTTPNALLDVAGTMRVTTICDRAGANCKTVSDGWASGGGGGDLPAADGTAAAPSISFTNDTDTGLFRPANGAVSVTSNGAVTAQFMSGSLLLGSQQDGSFGNLSVVAVQQNASLITYDEAMVTVKHFQNDTPDTYPRLDLLNYRGTPGAPARVLQGDTLGSIGFGGPNAGMSPYLGSGAGSVIKSYATADWDTNSDSDLRFYTTSASTTNEAVRISDTGNVGIGTTSPIARLHIARPSSPTSVTIANEYLHFGGDYQASNGYHLLGFGYRSPSGEIYPNAYMGFQETSTAGSGKGDLVFGTRNVTSDSVPSEAMRITAGGNVGIGITNPTVKLHVEGAIQAKNLAASITPTTAFWSTAPTSLTNVTDRNDATSSTEGVVAAGESALVTIDLGAVYRGIVFAYAKIRSGAAGGTAAFGVYQSDDNSTYAICSPGSQIGGTTLQTVRQQCAFWGRYIHLVCNADAVGTGKCTFYEVYFQQYQ